MTDPTPWRSIGAAVTGTAHLRLNLPCQDAFAYRALPTGELIMVVADGAGSATKADKGAAYTAQALVQQLNTALVNSIPARCQHWHNLLTRAFSAVRAGLIAHANQHQTKLSAYATTALVAVLTDQWTIGAGLGDGGLVVADQMGNLISLCPPQRGPYANMTNFLTQADALERLAISILPAPVVGGALFSDGLLPLALNLVHNRPHPPFFNPLFAFTDHSSEEAQANEQLADFLSSPRLNARTDDDKTLVLARRIQ
jgi:hypothetical protein